MSDPTPLRHRTVTTEDAVVLPVVEGGDPDGTPVVLLHGLASSSWAWEGVMADPDLARGRRLVAFDLRGHGHDPAPLTPAQTEDADPAAQHRLWARDLEAVLADLPPAHVVGLSFGAAVVQTLLRTRGGTGDALSITLGNAPNVLAPVAADDPAAGLLSPEALAALLGASTGGERVYAERVLARGPGDTTVDDDLLAAVAAVAAGTLPAANRSALSAPFDHRAFLAALPASERERLNVLVCEQDQIFDAVAMCACWEQSGVSAQLITGEGHMFPLRDPRRFASTLLGLIG